jgi:hypothetical protein
MVPVVEGNIIEALPVILPPTDVGLTMNAPDIALVTSDPQLP